MSDKLDGLLYKAQVAHMLDVIKNGEPVQITDEDGETTTIRKPVTLAFLKEVNAFIKQQGITAITGEELEKLASKFADSPFGAEEDGQTAH